MKRLIILFIVLGLFTISCTKGTIEKSGKKDYLEFNFQVGEQTDMSKYVVEISTDARTFVEVGYIFADPDKTKYTITIEATRYFDVRGAVYTRLKGISNNGHIDYSNTQLITKK